MRPSFKCNRSVLKISSLSIMHRAERDSRTTCKDGYFERAKNAYCLFTPLRWVQFAKYNIPVSYAITWLSLFSKCKRNLSYVKWKKKEVIEFASLVCQTEHVDSPILHLWDIHVVEWTRWDRWCRLWCQRMTNVRCRIFRCRLYERLAGSHGMSMWRHNQWCRWRVLWSCQP